MSRVHYSRPASVIAPCGATIGRAISEDVPIEPSRRLDDFDDISCQPCRRAAAKDARKLLKAPEARRRTRDEVKP